MESLFQRQHCAHRSGRKRTTEFMEKPVSRKRRGAEGRGARKGGRGAKIITMMKSESECNDDAVADVVELGSDRPYSVQKD